MFEGCTEINDYITEIFRMGLKESFTQIIDNSEIDGYYLSIPSRDKSKISKLNQWERLFVNIKTKSKRVYGEVLIISTKYVYKLFVCPHKAL